MASIEKRKVNIFLKKGKVTETKAGTIDDTVKSGVVIVAESVKNRLVKLRLYSIDYGRFLENFDVNEGLIKAFDYSNSYNGESNFSKDADVLRSFFINNYNKSRLTKDEKLEIKKFMFLTYKQAKEKRFL